MAKPITFINKKVLTEEEQKQQNLKNLSEELAENTETLQNTLAIMKELNDIGILEAVQSMLKAKEEITKILLGQVTREPVTNLLNNMMGAAGMLTDLDPAVTGKLLKSVSTGVESAEQYLQNPKKVGVMDLLKVLKDPDVNRAMGFGIHFLKGMGKGLGQKDEAPDNEA
jgi:uncharacterized protein YjgD (DUF1641 family)